jgi:hypothetical protein
VLQPEELDFFLREVDARREEFERLIEEREAAAWAREEEASRAPALRPATPMTSLPRAAASAP